jgi:hypothetical protein
MLKFLAGKKTYIVAILMGVVAALEAAGVIDAETRTTILAILGALGLSTLRAGISEGTPSVPEKK